MRPEIWVTGMGVMSAAGAGRDALEALLVGGRSAVAPVEELDGVHAGRAPLVQTSRRLDRSASLLIAAAEEAWRDAGLELLAEQPSRCALIEGSSLGPLAASLTSHMERLSDPVRTMPRPSALLQFTGGTGGAAFARSHRIQGPVFQLNAGSVSSAYAIGEACQMIIDGRVDIAIAGGTECPLHSEILAHFTAAGLLADRVGERAGCRPFDRRRSGTVLGEGSAMLVLESASHARRRGARPHALLRGFGMTCEAYSSTSPDPNGRGVTEAIGLATAQVNVGEIRWVKTHGTGTMANDLAECRGLDTAFGAHLNAMPITSLKSAIGHSLGASGALEAVAAILSLADGFVPATLGTEEPDPSLPPACHVVRQLERVSPGVALLLSEGFGGRCAALALEAA